MHPSVRAARTADEEAVATLLYESAGGLYDRFVGGRDRALRVLRRAFAAGGNNASVEVVSVGELGGAVAGALAAFPAEETRARAKAFLWVTLRTIPPWHWAGAVRIYYAGARAAPSPPAGALYVDALAVYREHRRQGVARALLAEAERRARDLRLGAVALDTSLDNKPARSLYLSAGFEEVAYRTAGAGVPGFVALAKQLR